ncbi:MAG: bifunctional oligoribonuclease/PAP phosphatase NrnA, partial [Treponemataceae bacterium]
MDDLQRARRFFDEHNNFILTTHEWADADGIGAEVVLATTLKTIGKRVRVVNATETSARFAFIDPEHILEPYEVKRHSSLIKKAVVVVLDSAERNNLGIVSDDLIPKAEELFAIDHHE